MGMARIIDAETLLSVFAQRYEDKIFSLSVKDSLLPENEDTFVVQGGECKRQRKECDFHFHVPIGSWFSFYWVTILHGKMNLANVISRKETPNEFYAE